MLLEQKKLDLSSRKLNYDLVTLPIGFGIGTALVKTVTIRAKSFTLGRSIFKSNSQ
jgi:hypothetical protein